MEFNSRIPIYLQVIENIVKRLVMGKIPPGSKLPSTRELAVEYNINPNTAARIYKEMEQMSICYTKRGLGTFATEDKKQIEKMKDEMAKNIISTFIDEMQTLGFEKSQMIDAINKEVK